ncbi:carboxypeptidase regulatory-like domain-containing protein [Myxococcus sp. K15C18031901]|uniref:carboxypeptidase regulatory-like domain-containing protein n=1 Tax=Myxococcus dinghuensis TaxID=2906761 RepID=UPI0020A703BC|nr:carboxypeptidase regulatory-like domain-containing protein [Myxococcus dinghuensis]MCP3103953.1 carboxypeptidase regulatory-like domain-containing protein [Myxococcus dinghuensis]
MRAEEGQLAVAVVSDDQRPLATARVTLYVLASEVSTPRWLIAGRGLTDATGRLDLPARPGRYLIAARREGFAPARAHVSRPVGEARTEVRLTLGAGATLEGRVVTRASGEPLAHAQLDLAPRLQPGSVRDEPDPIPEEELATGASDAHGGFRLHGLSPGDYQLTVSAPGHAPRRLPRVRVPRSGLVVELDGSAFIEGVVEHPNGRLPGPATVIAAGMGGLHEVETGPEGAFSIEVPPGVYRLSARHETLRGTAPGQVSVGGAMTARNVRIRLGGAASLAGLVREKGSGRPIGNAQVSISPAGLGATGTGPTELATVRTGADGRFEARDLPPGVVSLVVTDRPHHGKQARQALSLLSGQRFEVLVEMDATGTIEGLVVDEQEHPLAGVHVVPEYLWRMYAVEGATDTVTGADGTFTLAGIPAGNVLVAAHRKGSLTHAREKVTVLPGQTAKVRIQLTGEGTLEGRVRMADGSVPPGPATLQVQRVDAQRSEALQAQTSADGTFSMRVRAGRYRVAAWLTDTGATTDDKVVELEADKTQRADLTVREVRATITVTVLEPEGAPSVGATVMMSPVGKNEVLVEDVTDMAGQAVIPADDLGVPGVRVWATRGGRRGDVASMPTSQREVVVQLGAAGAVRGTVRSAGGRDVEGFHLVVSSTRAEEDYLTTQEQDFHGNRFVVDDVAVGPVVLTATLPDGRAGKANATTTAGGVVEVEVVVEAGGSVTGRLVDAKGRPVDRGQVDVDGISAPATGPDGRFRVSDVAPGEHQLIAWTSKQERAVRRLTLAAGKVQDVGDVKLEPPRVESGRLGLAYGMEGRDVIIVNMLEEHVGILNEGDIVKSIDGAVVLDIGEARTRELGPPGSPATLVILRGTLLQTVVLHRTP